MQVETLGTNLMGRPRNERLVAGLLALLFGVFLAWGWFAVVAVMFAIRFCQTALAKHRIAVTTGGRPEARRAQHHR